MDMMDRIYSNVAKNIREKSSGLEDSRLSEFSATISGALMGQKSPSNSPYEDIGALSRLRRNAMQYSKRIDQLDISDAVSDNIREGLFGLTINSVKFKYGLECFKNAVLHEDLDSLSTILEDITDEYERRAVDFFDKIEFLISLRANVPDQDLLKIFTTKQAMKMGVIDITAGEQNRAFDDVLASTYTPYPDNIFFADSVIKKLKRKQKEWQKKQSLSNIVRAAEFAGPNKPEKNDEHASLKEAIADVNKKNQTLESDVGILRKQRSNQLERLKTGFEKVQSKVEQATAKIEKIESSATNSGSKSNKKSKKKSLRLAHDGEVTPLATTPENGEKSAVLDEFNQALEALYNLKTPEDFYHMVEGDHMNDEAQRLLNQYTKAVNDGAELRFDRANLRRMVSHGSQIAQELSQADVKLARQLEHLDV